MNPNVLRDFYAAGRNVIRVARGRFFALPEATEPTADAAFRGATFIKQGGAGVADAVRVCLKDAADAYAWVSPAQAEELLIVQTADYTGTSNSSSAQKVFNTSTNGSTTVAGSTLYRVEGMIQVRTSDTDSASWRFGFGGTATYNWDAVSFIVSRATAAGSGGAEFFQAVYASADSLGFGGNQRAVTTAAAAVKFVTFWVNGYLSINAGGTLIPQYSYSATNQSSPVTKQGSWMRLIPTPSTIGAWA